MAVSELLNTYKPTKWAIEYDDGELKDDVVPPEKIDFTVVTPRCQYSSESCHRKVITFENDVRIVRVYEDVSYENLVCSDGPCLIEYEIEVESKKTGRRHVFKTELWNDLNDFVLDKE